jgi:hypothetical protein
MQTNPKFARAPWLAAASQLPDELAALFNGEQALTSAQERRVSRAAFRCLRSVRVAKADWRASRFTTRGGEPMVRGEPSIRQYWTADLVDAVPVR